MIGIDLFVIRRGLAFNYLANLYIFEFVCICKYIHISRIVRSYAHDYQYTPYGVPMLDLPATTIVGPRVGPYTPPVLRFSSCPHGNNQVNLQQHRNSTLLHSSFQLSVIINLFFRIKLAGMCKINYG